MSEMTAQDLSKAFELIEADRQAEACAILEPIIARDKDNADAWWLYSHAVADTTKAEDALKNVLRLDPNYPGAAMLMNTLREKSAMKRETFDDDDFDFDSSIDEDDIDADFDLDDDELGSFDDDGDEDEDDEGLSRGQILFRLLLAAALVIVLLVVFVVINPFGQEEAATATPTPGAQVAGATDAPTEQPDATSEPAAQIPTPEPVSPTVAATPEAGDVFAPVYAALSALAVVEGSAEVSSTELGDTLLVSVCSQAGEELRDTVPQAMMALSGQADALGDTISALGVHIVDCSTDNATLRIIAVSADDAAAYTAGTITEEEFRSRWRAVSVN